MFFAAVIIVVLQRFALIVSDLVYLDDARKGEDGRPRKEGTLEMVRRAVWGMLYADDTGVVSTSPRGLTRMMGVIVVTCQEFGLTVSEKKTEAMHPWSHPHTASNALRIEAAGQRYKQTTEFVYLGGAISESADLDIEIKRHIGAAWGSVRKCSSQLYDRRNARLSLKIRLFKAEVMEAMLYGCATWTMRSQDFSSLRTAHHKLLFLRIIGFRRKGRIGYKPLSYREVLERTGSERIETTIRKRQLGFAGALVRQGDSRLSKRIMFGRLAVQGPKQGGRPATSWVDCLQKNLETFGAVPRKSKGRKWVAFGVVVKDGRDWMTAAKNVGKWHRGVEKGAEALDSAWRRADLRQSNVQRQREVSEVVQYLRVRFCFALPRCCCLFLGVFSLRYTVGESGTRDAPPCGCLPLSLFDLFAVPLPLLLHFIPLCGALVVLVLALSYYLGCLALLIRSICIWLSFLPYAYYMWLPWFVSFFVPCFFSS